MNAIPPFRHCLRDIWSKTIELLEHEIEARFFDRAN
jgi:hypothetical protein